MKVGDLVTYRTEKHGTGIGFIYGKGVFSGYWAVYLIKHSKVVTLHDHTLEVTDENR